MLNRTLTVLLVAMCAAFISCESKKEAAHEHDGPVDPREWREMDSFHMIMAESFHPYKDSSNLQPAKELAGEMATAAREWKEAEAPEGVDTDKMKSNLDKLASGTAEFQELVKGGSDEAIASKLTELHDVFHDLQNEFYNAAGDSHDDHHHH